MALTEMNSGFGKIKENNEFELARGEIKKVTNDVLKKLKKAVKDKKKSEAEGLVKDLNLSSIVSEFIRKGNVDEVERMVKDLNYCRNYSSAFFPVWFKCDRKIMLTKLGFWGPAREKSGNYNVRINVHVGGEAGDRAENVGDLVYSCGAQVEARGAEVFTVALDQPVYLPSDTWCKVLFQLQGPRTCISSSASIPFTITAKESKATFVFHCRGSNQLPKLYYRLQ